MKCSTFRRRLHGQARARIIPSAQSSHNSETNSVVKPRRRLENHLVYQHDVTVGYASGAEGWMEELVGAQKPSGATVQCCLC